MSLQGKNGAGYSGLLDSKSSKTRLQPQGTMPLIGVGLVILVVAIYAYFNFIA